MSNVYIQEPPCSGKLCLKTTVGDIDVELWAKECPKACRNFVQLAMEGFYDDLAFHRLVKDFIVQGGDPSGTGMGGESIYGEPFRDEFHSRLRFNRRGLLGSANGGRKDDNNSQFFFTLGPTPELQNKHTLFGRVAGATLFNMLKLADGGADQNEKPLIKQRILSVEIITQPFPDIVPRKIERKREENEDGGEERKKKKEFKSKATKNFGLLSFGDEAEEEEEAATELNRRNASKSAHDILQDDKLSSVAAVSEAELGRGKSREELEREAEEDRLERLERVKAKLDTAKPTKKKRKTEGGEEDLDELVGASSREADAERRAAMRLEIRQLQKEIARAKRGPIEEKEEEAEPESEAMAAYHGTMRTYEQRQKSLPKVKTSSREEQTMAMLAKFQAKLRTERKKEDAAEDEAGKVAQLEARLKSLRESLGEEYSEEVKEEEEEIFGSAWMTNHFETDIEELRRAKDVNVEDLNSYSIHDRRNPMNVRRRKGLEAADEATSARLKELERYA